jgi:ABC-2 type transport system permease protein
MTTPSTARTVTAAEASPHAHAIPRYISPARCFYWSLLREFWEHRSLYIVPWAVAGLILAGFLLGAVRLRDSARLALALKLDDAHQLLNVQDAFSVVALAMMGVTFIVAFFYSLSALQSDRRDRSILFWKSMPVSDVITILSKATIPIVFVPLITFVVTVVTQWILLLIMSAVLVGTGFNVALLWTHFFLGHMWLMLLYHLLTVHALWYAPIFGYLLLVSAWSRRGAFLWATVPPLVIVIVEKIAFNTHYFSNFLAFRFQAGPEGGTPANMVFMNPLSNLTPLQFLWSTGLWDGLALTAVFLTGAVLLRRYRGVTTS